MLRLVVVAVMAATVIQIAACGGNSGSSQTKDTARAVEDIADIKADIEGLRGQLEDLAQQTAALERALEAPPDTGDD